MNILAFGAHPDDVEFLCSGTLFKYRQQGHKIYIALTTSGNQGSNEYDSRDKIAQIRESEQLEAAKLLDAQVCFLRFDDELLIDSLEARRAVINAMRWANPDIIFTNPPWDASPDHAETGKIVSKLMLSLPGRNIPADESPVAKKVSLFYWDIPGGIDFAPEVYVDISEFLEKKLEALSKHVSQINWIKQYGQDFFEYCTAMARFRGIQAGCKYAEGFRAFRIYGYMPDFKLLP
ncbi:MAG: PIG-L deacetylase family protein [Sedimentisphaerales bacterium]